MTDHPVPYKVKLHDPNSDYSFDHRIAAAFGEHDAKAQALLDYPHLEPGWARPDDEQQRIAAEDAIEAQYKEAYGDEPLAPWQAEGR